MQQPLGLILAGGRGARMGGVVKADLRLGSKRLLVHCLERLEPQTDGVVINTPFDLQTQVPVIADLRDGFLGPLAGLEAGLTYAEIHGHTHVVTVAVDTPFFPCDLVPRLLLNVEKDRPVVAACGPVTHGAFGLWPIECLPALTGFLSEGGRKVRQFAELQGATTSVFPSATPDPFFNINTPDDLTQAETWL